VCGGGEGVSYSMAHYGVKKFLHCVCNESAFTLHRAQGLHLCPGTFKITHTNTQENVMSNGHVHIPDGRKLCRKTFRNRRRGQSKGDLS